jgi:hypothetical protein
VGFDDISDKGVTMMDIVRWAQLIMAFIGTISSAIWFLTEKRRVRYIPFLWGMWCAGLMAFRVAVFFFPDPHTTEQVLELNSMSNTLYLVGATIVTFITINHIVGAYKHGRTH